MCHAKTLEFGESLSHHAAPRRVVAREIYGAGFGADMTRGERILTAKSVAALVEPGRHSDGGGLYLSIGADGRRRWIWLFRWQGKTREMGLGPASTVGLKEAREARDKWRAILQQGSDPIAVRNEVDRAADVPTFWACAEKLIADKAKGWKNAKHKAQWSVTLETHAAGILTKPIDQIDTAAVLATLRPIWTEKPETASRVRGRIEAVLDWARVHGHCMGENPARWRGHLDKLLAKPKKLSRGHHAALPYEQAPEFMHDLRCREAVAALALEFTILTACRSGEVLGARWDEIDLDAMVWTIPAARMKSQRPHRVPLSQRAGDVLRGVMGLHQEIVFPGQRRGSALSTGAMERVLDRMGVKVTVHGFRSTFRDWCGDCSSAPREVAESALAHIVGDKAEQAYRRGSAFEKRRELMCAWAAFLGGAGGANVVPLKRHGAV